MECYSLKNVSFSYPESRKKVIDELSLNIKKGDFFVLFGASGCGKSTLLKLLKTDLSPHGLLYGEINFLERTICEFDTRTQAQKIGFVSQYPDNQIVCDKVWHELAFGVESLGIDQQNIRSRIAEISAFFGIEDWFYRDVKELSGGQKQLLVLASVMVMNPEVLILDEPTSQLDPIATSEFLSMLSKINRELGITIIIAEHRLEEVFTYATETAVMENGKIICSGSPERVAKELHNNAMFQALPASMRLWSALDNKNNSCPITVKDGKEFIESYSKSHQSKEYVKARNTFGEIVLSADKVFFRYEKDGKDILKNFSLSLHKGEFFALVGGNGSGKSTALKVLSNIRKAQRGEISQNVNIGVLPQNPQGLFLKKTVSEDLKTMFLRDNSKEENIIRLQDMCKICEISHLIDRHPFDLSGGEMQRVALAKILLKNPDILLLDEPTKGMDASFKHQFAEIFNRLLEKGYSVLMVSHDIEFCAEYADTIGMFFDGSITAIGTPEEIFSDNHFYTTSVSRIVKNILPNTVTVNGVLKSFGIDTIKTQKRENKFATFVTENNTNNKTQKDKKEKLSLPRKISAAIFALISISIFLYATSVTDLTKMITSYGITKDGKTEIFIYGIFILSLFGFILSIAKKNEKSIYIQTPVEKRKLSKRTLFSCFLILLIIPLTLYIGIFYLGNNIHIIISIVILLECIFPFFMIFEGRKPKSREIVVISVLCGLGIAGRAVFFMLPQFKPVMALTIIAGIAFGAETGFMVGAITMLASNMLFSQGPWTPWQMFSMGIIGFFAGILFKKGLLRRTKLSIGTFVALSAIVIYGGIMNPASVLIWTPESFCWKAVLASYLSGFPMDLIHASATVIFSIFLAEPMLEKLDRIKIKYGLVE